MSSVLDAKHFKDEEAAYKWIEKRVWPDGRVCPHCGVLDRSGPLEGKSTRIGVYKCYACRKPFTVKVGTIFEASHIKLYIWLQAMFLMCSSKKGISANQLHRILGITLKSAWFMAHRIREAMRDGYHRPEGKMGGGGQVVEVDETYLGPNPTKDSRIQRLPKIFRNPKYQIMTLVERGGRARSFKIRDTSKRQLMGIMMDQVKADSVIATDELRSYKSASGPFAGHVAVNHSKGEYVRDYAHTNTVENYFSIFKRGVTGTYQHISEKHLHRYLAEFDFRYTHRAGLECGDLERTERAVCGIIGKRLTYR